MKTWLMAAVLFGAAASGFAEGPRRAQGPDGPLPDGPPEIMEHQDDAALEKLKEIAPEVVEELRSMVTKDAKRFTAMIMRQVRELRSIGGPKDPRAKERTVKRIKAQIAAHKLVQQYRDSQDDAEKQKLKPKIRESLNELFDAQLSLQELQVERMDREVKELKEKLEKRRKTKSDIVQRRLDEVTGETEQFEW